MRQPAKAGRYRKGPKMNAIIPRSTILQIEAQRARAIALYAEAFDLIEQARDAAANAAPSSREATQIPDQARRHLACSYGRPRSDDRAAWVAEMTKQVDRAVWSHLIQATDLERLMDRTAREQFRRQLAEAPPEATADNCYATLSQLRADASMIFQRGIATAFSGLDRRFRSHDGFKIGSRIVLTRAFTEHGCWNHFARQDETLRDVERAFFTLDGKRQPDRSAGIVGAIDGQRLGFRASAYEAESDYFRVRVFKNGNAHVWFLREDLVQRVNQILGEYYGPALGVGPDSAPRSHAPNRTMAKGYGFFESPAAVVTRLLEAGAVYSSADFATGAREGLSVLEPSAGRGAIAKRAAEAGHHVSCVEYQSAHATVLQAAGLYQRVINDDFLDLTPEVLGRFDRVLMNPPFDGGRDIDHVSHALRFLNPGGQLAAVMSAGVEFRQDRKAADFRAMVAARGGRFFDLPPGSFAEAGTNVNTCIVTIRG